jgi:hypothetical protein
MCPIAACKLVQRGSLLTCPERHGLAPGLQSVVNQEVASCRDAGGFSLFPTPAN